MKKKTFRSGSRRGFTLVEIMIVVLIIGIILAVAIPSFISARERSRTRACSSHLRQIKFAKEAWAMDNKKPVSGVAEWSDLVPTYIKEQPECPGSGDYTIAAVNLDPTCSIGGTHVLP